MSNLKEEFWARIPKVRSSMLGVVGQGRLVPMSPNYDDDYPETIWFITADGTDLAKAVEAGPQTAQMVVSDDKNGLYGDIEGTLERSMDREALDEVWSFVADAWFEGGKTDPDVRLLKFTPKEGELSVTPASAVHFLYQMAKAHVTDEKPDAGEQGMVSF